MLEVVIALAVVGVLLAMVAPPLGRLRAEAAVRSGGAAVTAAVARARSLAAGFARPADFVLDTTSWSYSVLLDTTLAGLGRDTVLTQRLPELRDVLTSVSSYPAVLCFDARGVGRSGPGCPTGLTLVLTAAGWVDTLAFSVTGRRVP